ncbi:uncharacterized protein LOC129948549 [Eupeodes corollae]|uniref:uncharacterized protein LOC129948549 n=1 Tax=Eupeodes corollae TaxID=290404 RepID=UPI0024920A59|nr:uncharacterized protein LOC129948549 [Eupeodes corollae]
MPGTNDQPVNAKADAPTDNSMEALEAQLQDLQQQVLSQQALAEAARGTEVESSHAQVRPPPFWRENVKLWFAQLEAQFTLVNLRSDARKFNLVIAHLDQTTASEVQDVIINPPQGNAYVRLKEELISRLAPSRDTQIRQMLDREQLGDRKPSQFLRRLKDLAGGTMTDDALKAIWIDRLPVQTQSILAAHPPGTAENPTNLDNLGLIADRINDVIPQQQVASTSSHPNPSFLSLSEKVEQLAKQVEAMYTNRGDQNRRLARSRSRSRARQNRNPTPTSNEKKNNNQTRFCYFHRNWGSKARNCRPPCDFNQQAGNENGCH